jgi:hypothetical protein
MTHRFLLICQSRPLTPDSIKLFFSSLTVSTSSHSAFIEVTYIVISKSFKSSTFFLVLLYIQATSNSVLSIQLCLNDVQCFFVQPQLQFYLASAASSFSPFLYCLTVRLAVLSFLTPPNHS